MVNYEELKKHIKEDTLFEYIVGEYYEFFEYRFEKFNTLMDIKEVLSSSVYSQKIKYIKVSGLYDDNISLGIKFISDESESVFSIKVTCLNHTKLYKTDDKRILNKEPCGLFRNLLKYKFKHKMYQQLIMLLSKE